MRLIMISLQFNSRSKDQGALYLPTMHAAVVSSSKEPPLMTLTDRGGHQSPESRASLSLRARIGHGEEMLSIYISSADALDLIAAALCNGSTA